ncbi:hypothetical protein ACP3P6_00880 [Enterobacter mori]
MMTELSLQGTLDERLLERRRGVLDGFGRHQSLAELLKQLLGDFWQDTRGFLLVGIHAPLAHVMPEHKISDSPFQLAPSPSTPAISAL